MGINGRVGDFRALARVRGLAVVLIFRGRGSEMVVSVGHRIIGDAANQIVFAEFPILALGLDAPGLRRLFFVLRRPRCWLESHVPGG